MEKEKETLCRIENDLKTKVFNLIECDSKCIPEAFRDLNEAVQSYCTFRTLLDKYSDEETDKKSEK